MRTDASIVERLKYFFSSKGVQYTGISNDGNHQGNCVMFSHNGIVIAVRIVEETDLFHRNSILEAALSSSYLTNQVNRVYLALPKPLSAAIDGKIIEQHGIGVVIFDQTTLEEVLAPKHFETKNDSSIRVDEERHRFLREEMTNLGARICSLEGEVESLRSEITRLRSIDLSNQPIPTPTVSLSTPISERTPSFMKDNPWVQVLSRRGQEGDRYVS